MAQICASFFNNFTTMGLGEKKKLPPRSKIFVKHQHNSPHKHHHHGIPFAPPMASIQWIAPIQRMGDHPKGLAKGA